jgi:spore germination cell wall hydrolase CwlJ-like protein
MKLSRRQKRIIKRKLKDFVVGALGATLMAGMTVWFVYAWATEPMTDWSEYIEENHIGMVRVAENTWLTQDEYEQMCRERDEYKAQEAAEEEAFYNAVLQSVDSAAPVTTATTSSISSYNWDADESYMLANIAMAEAEGEDTEGKALVILVVLNRVESDEFPDTINGVITDSGQFTAYENGRYDKVEPNEDCYKALQMVEDGWDESQGALYFERSTTEETWHTTNLEKLFEHGNHTFYTEQ